MKPPEREPPLILLVDDETEALDELSEVLTGAGYVCRCCTTAEEAFAAAEQHPPNLIISDVNLRGQSGLDMCERLKQNRALEDVPVMFLSAAQTPDIIRRTGAVGGTYHLRKPFDSEVLLELAASALRTPHLVATPADRP